MDFKICPHQKHPEEQNKTKTWVRVEEEVEEEDQETKAQFKLPVRSVSVRNLMVVFTFSPLNVFSQGVSFNILYLTLGNISFNLIFPITSSFRLFSGCC